MRCEVILTKLDRKTLDKEFITFTGELHTSVNIDNQQAAEMLIDAEMAINRDSDIDVRAHISLI